MVLVGTAVLVGVGFAVLLGVAVFVGVAALDATGLPALIPNPDADAPSWGGVTVSTAPRPPAVPAAINRNLFNF